MSPKINQQNNYKKSKNIKVKIIRPPLVDTAELKNIIKARAKALTL